ncbi:MAG: hypothetical protein JNG88_16230 [Phycisphaerales bacterium]|nr:hypothetical protein [Phycisphaerales bacterium]
MPRQHRNVCIALLSTLSLAGLCGCTSVLDTALLADESGAVDDATAAALENSAPIASAGDDRSVVAGDLVVLNGNGSFDPDADQLTFIWQQIDGDAEIELEGIFAAVARFDAPAASAATQLTFRLIVIDGKAVSTDDVIVTVTPAQ